MAEITARLKFQASMAGEDGLTLRIEVDLRPLVDQVVSATHGEILSIPGVEHAIITNTDDEGNPV